VKCTDCGATYPSKYYFVKEGTNGQVCTACAALTPEEREQRQTSHPETSPAAEGLRASAAVSPPAATEGSLHPLAVISFGVGLLSVFLFPTRSIIAGLVAVGLGFAASRDIGRSAGRSTGLRLARTGIVLGCGMAGAWTLTIAVGRLVDYLR
jgi:hypothetical protein